ncbi:hypothetical protein BCR44DRAFT_1438942 [Catenaria anguillulae PL171]|uniref:Uncharacterized protein n=1 Tax=Catenaria anguillulae PL171 TaxID=765915 RepID=A0A1Y2HG87_9FUNG|nr:hypothetical protein BCR44DRAFT_1438942 [Catenaria anguillulae PL171]
MVTSCRAWLMVAMALCSRQSRASTTISFGALQHAAAAPAAEAEYHTPKPTPSDNNTHELHMWRDGNAVDAQGKYASTLRSFHLDDLSPPPDRARRVCSTAFFLLYDGRFSRPWQTPPYSLASTRPFASSTRRPTAHSVVPRTIGSLTTPMGTDCLRDKHRQVPRRVDFHHPQAVRGRIRYHLSSLLTTLSAMLATTASSARLREPTRRCPLTSSRPPSSLPAFPPSPPPSTTNCRAFTTRTPAASPAFCPCLMVFGSR